MKKRNWYRTALFNLSRVVSFFSVISLVVTLTMLVFLDGMALDEALLRVNAKTTFLTILLMTFLGCGIDALRRHLTVERHLNRIVDALERITRGDFSVRLDTSGVGFGSADFREIAGHVNRLAGELSGVETLRTDFIANVSHEMKTPLVAVQNYATILQDPTLPPEKRQEYARAIAQTTRRLADLVTNILKLNKLENQKIFPEPQTFDLGEQLAQCLLEFEAVWEEKKLELECDIADEVYVAADPELLQLVWSNLFSNAMKFTPPGGTIAVTLREEGEWASVCVSDTGCGMTPETGAHIFEKFYQGDTAHATKGNGLGLALVKRVVDITGGRITVHSKLGEGSVFSVQIRRVCNGTA